MAQTTPSKSYYAPVNPESDIESFASSDEEEYDGGRDPAEDTKPVVVQLPDLKEEDVAGLSPFKPKAEVKLEDPDPPAISVQASSSTGTSPFISEAEVKLEDPDPPSISVQASSSTGTSPFKPKAEVKLEDPDPPAISETVQASAPSPAAEDHTTSPKAKRNCTRRAKRASLPPASPQNGQSSGAGWNTQNDPDVGPPLKRFNPKREPGPQLDMSKDYTPLELFSLFIDRSAINTLCSNTNKCAAKNIAKGKKYSWTKLEEAEMYKFIGLVFYCCCVGLHRVTLYWRQNSIFSVSFPAEVMTRDRFRAISWNIHMSDPKEDVKNDRKKGTPGHDRLFRLRPLLDTLSTACKSHYHPKQNLSIDERMVASRANSGMKQHGGNKPTKWGFKLFVLADSDNGYTVDFRIYTGKCEFGTGAGLSYDAVMALINSSYLGGGYHLYVDNFYTSPKLFRHLMAVNIGACGTYRDTRTGCPRSDVNALTKEHPRGTMRWMRKDGILYVKWMDSREVSICSTIHSAYTGHTVKRKVRNEDGTWGVQSVPCPASVIHYNKHMGGVDLSDQLIQYYSVHRKTMHWYRTLFYHFLDIAATNAYLLHKELCIRKKLQPMQHLEFIEQLTAELCGVTVKVPPPKAPGEHLPVVICTAKDPSQRATAGRKKCMHCRQTDGKKMLTPWKCEACDVALCIIPDRNCFFKYHQ